mgnify:CR=1 FL=1
MSRALDAARHRRDGFPRVSGDEPSVTYARSERVPFSPRERG